MLRLESLPGQENMIIVTPILQSLHWLPIKFRISYKILLLAYKALNDLAPAYLMGQIELIFYHATIQPTP